ncbi:beta-lactamase family protein [Novosphingobium sp. G106]|uniref:serine hydrolase domain-containing protein n=1 Tax=Novosphingobium sp. G106 TaxID=2849500 RepID=UPI001C2CCBFE|nr:serine hydrolase domain-containing protein [Novosphingobium sp. G106]MBV1691309.1 beta-lactamase family protein [Novosphingobium sp. G106]
MSGQTFSAGCLVALRDTIERHVASDAAPGAVGLVHRRGETHVMAIGTTVVGGNEPMARDSVFRIASMTKPVTAAAVMMLVDEGLLALSDPVERWLPELADRRVLRSLDAELDHTVPARRPITVEDVLTFRLGLGLVMAPPGTYPIQREIERLGLMGFGPPDPTAPLDNDAWMKGIGTLPLLAQPGEQWLYTAGSNVQGVLVARVAGMPLSRFLEERIFAPLSMVDTGFWAPPAKQGRLVPAYHGSGAELDCYDEPTSSDWGHPPVFEAGDAGLVSTVDDFLAFARMMLAGGRHDGRTILSEASVTAMTTDHLTASQRKGGTMILGDGHGWGYGLSVVAAAGAQNLRPDAIGWSGGLGTSWFSDPTEDLTAILLTQRAFEDPSGPPIHHAFQAAAYDALA